MRFRPHERIRSLAVFLLLLVDAVMKLMRMSGVDDWMKVTVNCLIIASGWGEGMRSVVANMAAARVRARSVRLQTSILIMSCRKNKRWGRAAFVAAVIGMYHTSILEIVIQSNNLFLKTTMRK